MAVVLPVDAVMLPVMLPVDGCCYRLCLLLMAVMLPVMLPVDGCACLQVHDVLGGAQV